MLTALWLAIGAIALVGVALVVWQSQRKALAGGQGQNAALPPLKRTVFTLQLGDIVQYEGNDWVVEGQLTFTEDGFSWLEYMLQDGDVIRWLTVEEDDRVEVLWMEPVNDLDIPDQLPKTLRYGNTTYRQTNSGTATMTRLGSTLNKQAQTCRFYDYAAESLDDQVLAIENWSGDLEVTLGRRIRPTALTLLPGDGRRVYDE
jgi:hypothetical protein